MVTHNVEDFIQGKSEIGLSDIKLLRGKSLDEMFTIDGIPLFWFYKRYLQKHVLPSPLNTFKELFAEKKLTSLRRASLYFYSLALRKYLFFQEYRKTHSVPKKNEYTTTKKALFLTYPDHLREGNQLYRIQGIIDTLLKDKILEPFPFFVTRLSSSAKITQKFPIIYQYYDKDIEANAAKLARDLARKWKKLDRTAIRGAMKFESVELWPYLSSAFSLFMSYKSLFILLQYYEICKKVIETENVVITFISGQNGLFERCIAAASRAKGVPCILLPHGFTIGGLPARDVLHNMHIPVFNKTTARSFIQSGVPEKQIRVTGPAAYDTIINYKRSNGLEKNILLLTQPLVEDNFMSQENYFLMVETVLREIASIPDVTIAIKLHPRERGIKRYEKIVKKIDVPKIFIRQEGEPDILYNLLAKASVVINFYATAGVLEASILDVPSITFPFDKQKSTKYGAFDPSLYVFEKESLKAAIEKFLRNPALLRTKRQELVQEFCTFVDGKSSERVVKWAYELLDEKQLQ